MISNDVKTQSAMEGKLLVISFLRSHPGGIPTPNVLTESTILKLKKEKLFYFLSSHPGGISTPYFENQQF